MKYSNIIESADEQILRLGEKLSKVLIKNKIYEFDLEFPSVFAISEIS